MDKNEIIVALLQLAALVLIIIFCEYLSRNLPSIHIHPDVIHLLYFLFPDSIVMLHLKAFLYFFELDFFHNFFVICDSGVLGQLSFQDPATVSMEGIFLFNLHLLFVIIGIVFLVSWLIYCVIDNFLELTGSTVFDFTHSELIEIVWTSLPTLILLSLAYPSFSLLYSLDEISAPDLTVKIIGHQWYWSYEISDFNCCSKTKNLRYSAYMLSNEYLTKHSKLGFLRLLETNKKVVLPIHTHLRLLITSVDVLHSWTIPSFGVKVDACPGRLNQANLFIKRFGFFFGQCSEICGVNHGFMPIAVLALPSDQYYHIIASNLKF